MANIAIPTTFAPSTVAQSAQVNANFSEVATKFNTYAVQTDVAKTIAVSHTQAADLLFTDALYDIGKSGATRPRDGFFSRNLTVGGTLSVSGATALQALSATTGTFAGNLVVTYGGASASLTLNPTAGGPSDSAQVLLQRNGALKWQMGSNISIGADVFEIYSTGAAGVAMQINPATKAVTFANGLTVSAGTTATQALTATTGSFSGSLLLATNATYLRGTTSASAVVNLLSLTADANNFTRILAGVDLGGIQFTNQAQTLQWFHISGTAITASVDLLFTDALYDIGKSGATRPRDGFFSRNLTVGGTLTAGTTTVLGAAATGTLAVDSTTGAVSDVAQLLFKRGGVTKWSMGNNLDGINIDDFSLYAGATNVMSASSTSFSIQNAVAFNVSGQTTLSTTSTGNLTVTGTMSATGRITTAASAAGGAGFRLPHGAAPTIPVDGDMWTTAAGGAFIRINGVTKTFTLT